MIWTENTVPVPSTSYTAARTRYLGMPGAEKITLNIQGAAVMLQVLEELGPRSWPEPLTNEMRLDPGFSSRPLPRRIYAYRLRAIAGPATATVTAYG